MVDGILYNQAEIDAALALGSGFNDVFGNAPGQIRIEPKIDNYNGVDHTPFDHGTHTAAIAAGSDNGGTRCGAAPESDIICVVPRLKWYDSMLPGGEWPDAYIESAILEAFQCIFSLSEMLGKPAVAYCINNFFRNRGQATLRSVA